MKASRLKLDEAGPVWFIGQSKVVGYIGAGSNQPHFAAPDSLRNAPGSVMGDFWGLGRVSVWVERKGGLKKAKKGVDFLAGWCRLFTR